MRAPPYAVVTARNLVHALGREQDRSRRHAHRLLDLRTPADPAGEVLMKEDSEAGDRGAPAAVQP
jgi:hypothetical protein